MFGPLGIWEIVLILIIALIVFGPGKLPDVGKALGKGLKEFKSAANSITNMEDDEEKVKTIEVNSESNTEAKADNTNK